MFFIFCILFFVSTIFADSTSDGGSVSCIKENYLKGFCVGDCEDNAVTEVFCQGGHESWFSEIQYVYGNLEQSEDKKILECPRRTVMTSICSQNCEHNGETYDYMIGCKGVVEGVQWNKHCTTEVPENHGNSDFKSARCSGIPLQACFSTTNTCMDKSYSLRCCDEEYVKDLDGLYTLLYILPPLFIAIQVIFCVLNKHFAIIKRADKKAKDDNYVPSKKRPNNITTSSGMLWTATSMANLEKGMQLEMQMLQSEKENTTTPRGPDMRRMGSRI